MEKQPATWVGPRAARMLATSRQFRVHSVFDRSVNLVSADRLLHLSAPTAPALDCPFGVVLSTASFAAAKTAIRANHCGVWTWNSRHWQLRDPAARLIAQFNAPPRSGAAATAPLAGVLPVVDADPGALFPRTGMATVTSWPHFHERCTMATAELLRAAPGAAGWFLGRGPGLTPSGDDVLIGMIAAFYRLRLPARSSAALAEWKRALLVKNTTTAVSREYLLAATDGHFAGPLARLLDSDRHGGEAAVVADLLAVGHTSGADTLLGFSTASGYLRDHVTTRHLYSEELAP